MEIGDFYIFGNKMIGTTVHAEPMSLQSDDKGVDPENNLIRGNYEDIQFPVIFKQYSGKKLLDFLDTGWPGLQLISDKFKNLLEENHITGWKTYPIKLYDKKDNEILGYHGFSITGRCGPIEYEKAEIVDRQRIPTGPIFQVYKGLYIGLDKWDGTDCFLPEKTLVSVMTKKAMDILKKAKITNLEFKSLIENETEVRVVKMIRENERRVENNSLH